MGYYTSCSPYDVQARNGGRFTFDTIKQRYEDTPPIRGTRKEQNIRPIKQRDRSWERMIKVDENEYYVSFDCYQHRTNNMHNRAITWRVSDDMEWLTVHTPKKVWVNGDGGLNPRAFSSSSTYWFYDFNLPSEFGMVNYRSNKYVKYNNKFYTIEKGDITFARKRGANADQWQPLVVHREFKHTLDRQKTKEYRALLKPFIEYYNVMSDMVEADYSWGNTIVKTLHKGNFEPATVEQVLDLFKPCGTPHDLWLKLTEYIKHKTRRYDYYARTDSYDKTTAISYLTRDLFEVVKPCKEVEVELGKLSHDRYKAWYR
jgi:hypothetical protein